jgi:hypothetical protein
MRNIVFRGSISFALIVNLMVLTVWAQPSDDRQKKSEERPRRQLVLYQLDFSLDETLNGKPSGTRNFKMMMTEGETSRVRIGSKMLISGPETEPKFVDLGLKFDCKVGERDGYISIDGKLELNEPVSMSASPLTIRNFQVEIETAVLPDKATTIGVYDDDVSKRRYELRVTVTKAK